MITETAGSCTSGLAFIGGSRYRERGTPPRPARGGARSSQIVWAYGAHDPSFGRSRGGVPPCPHAAPLPPPPAPAPHSAGPPGPPYDGKGPAGPCGRRPRCPSSCSPSAGIGHAVVTSLDADIARVDPFKDMKNRPRAGHGMNVLLVGTDGRDKITEAERQKYRLGGAPCHCTDTIMIVHISEDRERASVVSLPRDSYAMTPAHVDRTTGEQHHGHPIKINAAYAEGGPQLTVRTVENMTHVKIDHYLEVDFTSFMKTVDVLGGVEICNADPLKDTYTGPRPPSRPAPADGRPGPPVRPLPARRRLLRPRPDEAAAAIPRGADRPGHLLRDPAEPDEVPRRDPGRPRLRTRRQGLRHRRTARPGPGDADLLPVLLRVHDRADRADGIRREGHRLHPEVGPGEVRPSSSRPCATTSRWPRTSRRARRCWSPWPRSRSASRSRTARRRAASAAGWTRRWRRRDSVRRAPRRRGRPHASSARSSPTTPAGTAPPAHWRRPCPGASCGR